MRPARVVRSAIALKPSTLLHLHSVLRKRKYRMLLSSGRGRRPGPKGPNKALIDAVVAMKRRNPNWGCPRIAQQITLAFGVEIDKDVVRRLLSVHYRPEADSGRGPSWLTFFGHMKDSLWSCDLFRCESATLRTHWVLVVMDQFTVASLGLASAAASLMEWRCAGCSAERFAGTVCQIMAIERMRGWKDACQNRLLPDLCHQ
jgi:putative transposase